MWNVKLGDASIYRIEDLEEPKRTPAQQFARYDPAVMAEAPELAAPHLIDPSTGQLVTTIHSWLLKLGSHVVLIDTALGRHKNRKPPTNQRYNMMETRWLENLAACGVEPDDVTMVINTHLHLDHTGWNTSWVGGRWVPTFRNARYLIARAEYEHWHDPAGGPRYFPANVASIDDSVDPIAEAGQLDTFEFGDEILPGLTSFAAPGHTAGQAAIVLNSRGKTGMFSADIFHYPMQVVRPDWSTFICEQPEVAAATRLKFLADAAQSGALVFPSHTGAPYAGYIRRHHGGFRFVPIDATFDLLS